MDTPKLYGFSFFEKYGAFWSSLGSNTQKLYCIGHDVGVGYTKLHQHANMHPCFQKRAMHIQTPVVVITTKPVPGCKCVKCNHEIETHPYHKYLQCIRIYTM